MKDAPSKEQTWVAAETLKCRVCEGALDPSSLDLWHGSVDCPYCGAANPLAEIANLNAGQLEYLAELQRQGDFVSLEDYAEDIEKPLNSRMTFESSQGDCLRVYRPWYSLGIRRIGDVVVVFLLVALVALFPMTVNLFMGEDAALAAVVIGLLVILPFTYIAFRDAFSNWTLVADRRQIIWQRKLGPLKRKTVGQLDVKAIEDVRIWENPAEMSKRYKKRLRLVTGSGHQMLSWQMSLPEMRYLRARLLGFLRSVDAPSMKIQAVSGTPRILCSHCGVGIDVTHTDFWHGIVTCGQCRSVTKLGAENQLAPIQQQILGQVADTHHEAYLEDYDDDAPPPFEPVIVEQGELGKRLVLTVGRAPISWWKTAFLFWYLLVGSAMLLGIGYAMIQGRVEWEAAWVIAIPLSMVVFAGVSLLRPLVKERIVLTPQTLVRRRGILFFGLGKRVLLKHIEMVRISRWTGKNKYQIYKRCYLRTSKGTVNLGCNADAIGAVYLRALVSKHLRAVIR